MSINYYLFSHIFTPSKLCEKWSLLILMRDRLVGNIDPENEIGPPMLFFCPIRHKTKLLEIRMLNNNLKEGMLKKDA